jgi:hypothetical protein
MQGAAAMSLSEIRQLAASGAPQLALQQLQQLQPPPGSAEWSAWEVVRLDLLREARQWAELIERIDQQQESLSPLLREQALRLQMQALLASGRAGEVLDRARRLLWQERLTAQQRRWLRQMIIESYLHQRLYSDARTALLRFLHDYGDSDHSLRILQARILLATGRAAEAERVLLSLASDASGEVKALTLLASLRVRGGARQVVADARQAGRDKRYTPEEQATFFAVASEGSLLMADSGGVAIALEALFSLPLSLDERLGLFQISPDDLWQAYLDYAEKVSNREQLLRGDDQRWFDAAVGEGSKLPIRRRSLLTYLAFHALDDHDRQRAHELLLNDLLDRNSEGLLLQRLYLDSQRFAEGRPLPLGVAQQLLTLLLRRGDLARAATLIPQIQPLQGEINLTVAMRQVKIALLGGETALAVDLLRNMVAQLATASSDERDRYLQLLFDLQAIDAHDEAVDLMQRLLQQLPDDASQMRREIWFWMADSRLEQRRYLDAAQLYLKSAMVIGVMAMDPWAQTARYQAATALMKFGLLDDAEQLLRQLLAVASSSDRKGVLLRDLEQITLLRARQGRP